MVVPDGPVGPVGPCGIVRFNIKFGAVPVIVADAVEPGAPVVTFPIVTVGVAPVAPVAPVGPVGPVGPAIRARSFNCVC